MKRSNIVWEYFVCFWFPIQNDFKVLINKILVYSFQMNILTLLVLWGLRPNKDFYTCLVQLRSSHSPSILGDSQEKEKKKRLATIHLDYRSSTIKTKASDAILILTWPTKTNPKWEHLLLSTFWLFYTNLPLYSLSVSRWWKSGILTNTNTLHV